MTPEELLAAAAAAVAAAVGHRVVLAGGAAVNLHTGAYRPTDIDLITPLGPADRRALERLGLVSQGRHYRYDTPTGPILVEFPDDHLDPMLTTPPEIVDVAPGVTASVVAVDDLMLDRALQATDGTPVTFDEALRLAVAAYPRIDWDDLRDRATAASTVTGTRAADLLPDTLARIQRAAKRRLRSAGPLP
jgi:hypothetical protein